MTKTRREQRRELAELKRLESLKNTVFLDTETTGLDAPIDEVLEIAIVDFDGNTLLDTLIKPAQNESWAEAQEIHGISPKDVADAPTLEEVQPRIDEIIEGKTVVVYNYAFDEQFVDLSKAGDSYCAMLAYSNIFGEWSSYWGNRRWVSLAAASRRTLHDWGDSEAHRALADALACRTVWRYLEDDEYTEQVNKIHREAEER